MKILPVRSTSIISFKYRNILKTAWKKGNIPELIHDFYDGSLLNSETVTLEHLKPHSQGGKTTLTNLVLTSFMNNFRRGNQDIRQYINIENAKRYIEEARKINIKGINGEYYANELIKRLKSLGVEI